MQLKKRSIWTLKLKILLLILAPEHHSCSKSRFSPTVKAYSLRSCWYIILIWHFGGAIIGGISGKIYEKKCHNKCHKN
jgi:hypothetical protein